MVTISIAVRPPGIPQQVEECFRLFLDKARDTEDPFEQAFFTMVHLPYLQPFTDVNKRTARLGASIPLIKNKLCPLSFIDVPERDETFIFRVICINSNRRNILIYFHVMFIIPAKLIFFNIFMMIMTIPILEVAKHLGKQADWSPSNLKMQKILYCSHVSFGQLSVKVATNQSTETGLIQ